MCLDSGEGRWTVDAAIDEAVPAYTLSAALFSRFSSRGQADYADKLLSAMRKQFGGHDEKRRVDCSAAGSRRARLKPPARCRRRPGDVEAALFVGPPVGVGAESCRAVPG